MRLTKLYLRNYRVYEDEVELEVPPGLVGIYGANGAGKSTLLEAVLFALWGRARTTKDEIRTSGINDDCVAEVTFEHEGHLYVVRRTISGQASNVRAQAYADGGQVAEGVKDTNRYVHSVLGMDDGSFRASVFAEQKQLASFSDNPPADRRRLVLGLLGVTPLDLARDQARHDARDKKEHLEQLRSVLSDLDALATELEDAEKQAVAAGELADKKATSAEAVSCLRDEAEREHDRISRLASAHDGLAAEGRAKRSEQKRAQSRIDELSDDLRKLEVAEARMIELADSARGMVELEEAVRLARELGEAEAKLAELGGAPSQVTGPDEASLIAARAASENAKQQLAQAEGALRSALAERERAQEYCRAASQLSGEASCPLCGQELGSAFEQVRGHRHEELDRAQEHATALERQRAELRRSVEEAAKLQTKAEQSYDTAHEAWVAFERRAAMRAEVESRVSAARSAAEAAAPVEIEGLGATAIEVATEAVLAGELARRRKASEECAWLRGRLEGRGALEERLAAERAHLAQLEEELSTLGEKLNGLGYRPELLEAAQKARAEARANASAAVAEATDARVEASRMAERVSSVASRIEDGRAQHAKAEQLSSEVVHVGRVAELLSSFRNTVVSAIGPRLSAEAGSLFAELTDRDYDSLEVDPDTYEIQIRDRGTVYGMDRFSGSETDLANLALRVAISEQVRLQSGGAVGLLVLDEVFGPLDDDRRARMLGALERLRGRFRQILVVTHDNAIKEQLPNAIEVARTEGRRARARLL